MYSTIAVYKHVRHTADVHMTYSILLHVRHVIVRADHILDVDAKCTDALQLAYIHITCANKTIYNYIYTVLT